MPRRKKGAAVVQAEPPVIIQYPPWGRWSREHVRIEGTSARIADAKGEFLVLGSLRLCLTTRCARKQGAKNARPALLGDSSKKKTTRDSAQHRLIGSWVSGIAVNIKDEELTRGAQDTHFKDRIWHYGNTDGAFRN
eukprot:725759-Rhodomonas_salina.1